MRFYVSIYVTHIPNEIGADGVLSICSQHGNVLDVSQLEYRPPTGNTCSVVMENECDAQRAINELNQVPVEEGSAMRLTAKFAPGKYVMSRSIFVGSLPFSATVDSVTKFFLQYGRVKGVHILKQKVASSDKCALVHFRDRYSAFEALRAVSGRLSSPTLEVRFATAKITKVEEDHCKIGHKICDCHMHKHSDVWVHHPYTTNCPQRDRHDAK